MSAPESLANGTVTGDGESEANRPLIDFRNVTSAVVSDSVQPAADEVTCVAMHPRLVIVGTRSGALWRLDMAGKRSLKISSNPACINSVSMDAQGAMVATGTADGRVNVMPLEVGAGDPWVTDHSSQAVLSVVVCPEYMSPTGLGPVVCAGGEDGRLVRYRRRMMGAGRTVLHENEGAISKIVWRTPLICWCNDFGVKLFNIISGQRVSFIPRPAPTLSMRPFTCQLAWATDDHLLMAWGDVVKVAVVLVAGGEAAAPAVSVANSGRTLVAKVQHEFKALGTVAGLAPTGAKSMGMLTVALDGGKARALFALCSFAGRAFHTCDVPLRGAPDPMSMQLCALAPHLPMYVTAARDILCFQMRDFLEFAVQLLEQGRFDQALQLAEGGGDGVQGLRHIVCLKSVVPQLKAGDFARAVGIIRSFRELDGPTWQECVVLFDSYHGLRHVVEVLPVDAERRLPREVYDEALRRLVEDPSTLQAVLSWWPIEVYSAEALAQALRERLGAASLTAERVRQLAGGDRCRAEALALVEAARGELLAATRLYADLGKPEVFRLLRMGLGGDRPLAPWASGHVRRLFEIDDQEACAVLVEHYHVVSVDSVVAGLEAGDSRWKHEYLKALFLRDEVVSARYHMQMVELYATYEPQDLLSFLRASERYPLEDALKVCSDRGLLEEKAYLLGKVGRVSDALKVLLEELGDVGRAVQFAADYQDFRLWEFLITFALARPHLLAPLLENLEDMDNLFGQVGRDSGRAQPPQNARAAHVLRRLPATTPVSRVAAIVGRIFRSVELMEDLRLCCTRLSRQEVRERKRAIIHTNSKGSVIAPEGRYCGICGVALGQPAPGDGTIVDRLQRPEGGDGPDVGSQAWADQALLALRDAAGGALQPQAGLVVRGQGVLHARCYEVGRRLGRLPTARFASLARGARQGEAGRLDRE